MRPKSPFKQFAKDCPEHFSREILVKGKLPIFNEDRKKQLYNKYCIFVTCLVIKFSNDKEVNELISKSETEKANEEFVKNEKKSIK